MAQYRFKLLRGTYVDHDGAVHEGNSPSAFIDSDVDLAGKFGSEKFMLLAGPTSDSRQFTPPSSPSLEGPENEVSLGREPRDLEELEGMDVGELRSFAASEEIDLRGVVKKADILERIKSHLADQDND